MILRLALAICLLVVTFAGAETIGWKNPTTRINGTALPSAQIGSVQIFDNGTQIGQCSGPCTTFTTPSPFADGDHSLTVTVTDTSRPNAIRSAPSSPLIIRKAPPPSPPSPPSQLAQIFITPPTPGALVIPTANDASLNWRGAGLLSIGGIPARNTQCGATLNPVGLITTVTASITGGNQLNITSGITTGIVVGASVFNSGGPTALGNLLGVVTGGSGNTWSLAPGANTASSTIRIYGSDVTSIANAIAACTAGQFVNLAAGSFLIDGPNFILLNKGITLRGAGAGGLGINSACASTCTNLWKTNGATATTIGMSGAVGPQANTLMLVGPTQYSSGTDPVDPTGTNLGAINGATALTADGAAGASSVTVASTSGLSVGQYVVVDSASPAAWQVDTLIGNNPVAHSATIVMTCATPSVITWGGSSPTAHLMGFGTPIRFSGGTLCAGFTAATDYYITHDSLWSPNSQTQFHLSDTQAHANAGTDAINGTGSSSGTITASMQGASQVWAEPAGAGAGYQMFWKKHNPTLMFIDDFGYNEYPVTPISNGDQYNRLNRPQSEIKKITNIAGSVVTFESPLTKSYLVANIAQVATYTETFLERAGVENMSIIGGDSGNVTFKWCAYCWAKNIESTQWLGQGLEFVASYRNELRASYSHDAAGASPGGGAYAIAFDLASSEILVENNISIISNKTIVARAAGAGSVVGYNYFDDSYINYNEAWIEIGCNASHFNGPHHILFEGNSCQNIDSDDTHGSSNYITYFRNWSRGLRAPFTNPLTGDLVDDANQVAMNGPFRAYGPKSYSSYFAMACNVAGISGTMSAWVFNQNNWASGGQSIWLMGWDTSAYTGGGATTPDVGNTIWRAGNWDWLTSSQLWQTGTNGQSFPSSLYYNSKPAFMGSSIWPWVDCTNGSTGTFNSSSSLPALARFRAGTPNVTPND